MSIQNINYVILNELTSHFWHCSNNASRTCCKGWSKTFDKISFWWRHCRSCRCRRTSRPGMSWGRLWCSTSCTLALASYHCATFGLRSVKYQFGNLPTLNSSAIRTFTRTLNIKEKKLGLRKNQIRSQSDQTWIFSFFWILLLSLAILKYIQYFLMLQTLKLNSGKQKKSLFYVEKVC